MLIPSSEESGIELARERSRSAPMAKLLFTIWGLLGAFESVVNTIPKFEKKTNL